MYIYIASLINPGSRQCASEGEVSVECSLGRQKGEGSDSGPLLFLYHTNSYGVGYSTMAKPLPLQGNLFEGEPCSPQTECVFLGGLNMYPLFIHMGVTSRVLFSVKEGIQIQISFPPTELHNCWPRVVGRVPYLYQYGDDVLCQGNPPCKMTPPHIKGMWPGMVKEGELHACHPFLACQTKCVYDWIKVCCGVLITLIFYLFFGNPQLKSIPDKCVQIG